MKYLVLDTNILFHLVRGTEEGLKIKEFLESQANVHLVISVVSIAEAESVVKKTGNWGVRKINKLRDIIKPLMIINIDAANSKLINSYVSIDAYSQGKIPAPDGQALGKTPRNMGKNDLWIAATTHSMDATLLTTDDDFDHLHKVFFEVKKY